MAASRVFLHVTFKKKNQRDRKLFVRADTSQSIGDAILQEIEEQDVVSAIKSGSDPNFDNATDTPTDTPIQTLLDFGSRHIFVVTNHIQQVQEQARVHEKPDAFEILMSLNKRYNRLPERRPESNNKDRLYNAILNLLEENQIGFTAVQVQTTGVAITKVLTNSLWYLDPHQEKFQARGILLPEGFRKFKDFNDWRANKRKAPQITSADLEVHIGALCDMVMMPWFLNDKFKVFKQMCTDLIEGLRNYHKHLKQQQGRSLTTQGSLKPVRSLTDSWTCGVIEASDSSTKQHYAMLEKDLDGLDLYQPLFLFDYEPTDRYDRRKWIEELKLSYPIRLYQHHHGNYFGNFSFAWKIAAAKEDRGDKDLNAIDRIRENMPSFSTRAIRKGFVQRYSKSNILKPAILRDVFRFLTQDSSAAETQAQSEVDERVADFLLNADDSSLFYDLRKNNGRPKNKALDPFWEGLDRYLEGQAVVHERRQGDVMYMPLAMSMQNLIDVVSQTLPPDTPLPSVSWLRLNFWPTNAYNRAAMCYTGRYKIKYAVQQRLLRSKHPDSGFAFKQFQLLKDMAVRLREKCRMICLDDKAIIPIGEPDAPISTGVRPHSKSLVPVGVKLVALDHDFHVQGVVPSVLFDVSIPTDPKDSFYAGSIHVTVKNKVFEPSTAVRHMTETNSILQSTTVGGDGVSLDKPVLFVFTDGGPDHRSTFWTVQLAFIALFVFMDLDLLVSIRTAPSHSYANPAERCMSILNMALQHTSLSREKMDETAEFKVKSLSSLKQVRQTCERQPILKEAMIQSMEPVIAKLKMRFSQLRHHNEPVIVHDAATVDEMDVITSCLDIFLDDGDEPDLFKQVPKMKDAAKFPKLDAFISNHCRRRQYSFQVKKCDADNCWYCTLNPPRLEDFGELHYLPDPTLDNELDEWKSFDQLYGLPTSDDGRPSLKEKVTTPSENDKVNKGILVAAKVRAFILCFECGKRRVVYSKQKLSRIQEKALDTAQDELSYSCGSPLFPEGSSFADQIVVKEAMNCSSPIEVAYYGGITQKFRDICFYCGDDNLSTGQVVQNLQTKYSIVRPICEACLASGKQPAVRNALKLGKRH